MQLSEGEGMKAARIVITPELMAQAFGFPPTALVYHATVNELGLIELAITDDTLPDIAEGCSIPLESPQIERVRKECGCEEIRWHWSVKAMDSAKGKG